MGRWGCGVAGWGLRGPAVGVGGGGVIVVSVISVLVSHVQGVSISEGPQPVQIAALNSQRSTQGRPGANRETLANLRPPRPNKK